jgi:sortase A
VIGLSLLLRGPRLSRRGTGFLGGLAVFVGLVLLADAVVTVLWEDPFTTIFTQQDQKALAKKLAAAESQPLPKNTLELVRSRSSPADRMALLAAHERATARPGDPLGRVYIPKTGKNFVFVSGTGVETLKKGPGHYWSTALPGEPGTVAIAGHRTTYGAPFHNLNKLRPGYAITLTMPYGRFAYSVEESRSVSPTKITVLRNRSYERLVLTTCDPIGSAAKRLVVFARLEQVTPRGPAIELIPVPPTAPQWLAAGLRTRSG